MAYNFGTYINFFRDLAEHHNTINYFVFGNARQIIDEQKSSFQYPCLILDIPEISSSGDNQDSLLFNISGSIQILKQYAKGDFAAKEQVLVDTEKLIRDVISYIRKFASFQIQVDSPRLIFTNIRMQIQEAYTANNLAGWIITFNYKYAPNYEFNSNKWTII